MAVPLSGCVQHEWLPSSGMQSADFAPAKAQCSMIASNSGVGFAAYGSQSYVAGAALGNAIGNSIRAQETFNNCLLAKGWRVATPEIIAAANSKRQMMKSAADAAGVCVQLVRERPMYATLASFFSNATTGRHTMAQLASDRTPTLAEAQLYTTYRDETNACADRAQAEYEAISPAAASVILRIRGAMNDNVLSLVTRQQTWSSFFQRAEKINQQLADRTRLIQL
jgi:hypothetical protein